MEAEGMAKFWKRKVITKRATAKVEENEARS
jgi:hypothetical protein